MTGNVRAAAAVLCVLTAGGCRPTGGAGPAAAVTGGSTMSTNTNLTEERKQKLTPLQLQVTQCSATERPFSGKYHAFKGEGIYHCVCCDRPLFSSAAKFDSGTGWPSYWQPVAPDSVVSKADHALGMARTEIRCGGCGAHLGHVFDDGPKPTGRRYCINSAALDFRPAQAHSAPP